MTITHETWLLLEELRNSFPLEVSQGEVVRSALLVLHNQPDPLESIAKAKHGTSRKSTQKKR